MSEKITIKKQEFSAKCGVCPKHNYNQENDIYSVTFNHNSNQGTIVNLCLGCMDEIIDNLNTFIENEKINKLSLKKFKENDKVKLKDDLIIDELYGNDFFISEMAIFKNKILTIEEIQPLGLNGSDSFGYLILEDDCKWTFTDEMLELYEGE